MRILPGLTTKLHRYMADHTDRFQSEFWQNYVRCVWSAMNYPIDGTECTPF
jgi:hypothetical protein